MVHERGVSYEVLDKIKRFGQETARGTEYTLKHNGVLAVPGSRGESAFVWEEPDRYGATVLEGLGTKALVADQMRRILGKTNYDIVGWCTAAAAANDLLACGAEPVAINLFVAAGSNNAYLDEVKMKALHDGFGLGCKASWAAWGTGETQVLRGIIHAKKFAFAASAVGYIKSKENYVHGGRIKPGDAILFIESNGLHANGFTEARDVARKLPRGFATRLSNGKMYGEELLTHTGIYAQLIHDLLRSQHNLDIHYMSHITGHGWTKIMRPVEQFRYVIDTLPKLNPIFPFIQKHSGLSDFEMYKTFNMGAGFAIILPEEKADMAILTSKFSSAYRYNLFRAGHVEEGPKEVNIVPKGIKFKEGDLDIR